MQAVLGYTCEAKWLRRARTHLRHLLPYLPQRPGCNGRLRKAAGLTRSVNRIDHLGLRLVVRTVQAVQAVQAAGSQAARAPFVPPTRISSFSLARVTYV
jgi:hypothetical protein